ncbi:MAG: hypothetical protein LBM75_02720 [Myxococcales bacterium]|jgi:hypothetical protein|nr:hypothetical protein [Myxococcales bacterium]
MKTCSKNLLIVEGKFDKEFLENLLKRIGISVEIVTPQTSSGAGYGGKGNAITLFISSLKRLEQGSLEKLALVIDADFSNIHTQGFQNTLKSLLDPKNGKLKETGFDIRTKSNEYQSGLFFRNESLECDIALWIMPYG